MGKRWTEEDIKLLRKLKDAGLSESEITKHFPGRTQKAIQMKAFKVGAKLPPPENLVGKTFGRWHVVGPAPYIPYQKIAWDCICDCQMCKPEEEREHHFIQQYDLNSGNSKSCGCLKIELQTGRTINKKYNRYEERDEYMIGYTTKGEEFYFDKEDYELIRNYCWGKTPNGYLRAFYERDCHERNHAIVMHRLIMNPNNWDHNNNEVDHINGIRWDNRRCNLRIVTHSENMKNMALSSANSSGYKGVSYIQRDDLWSAHIRVDGKQYVEYYHSREEAIEARKRMEEKYYGEFARAPEYLLNRNGEVNNSI